MSSSTDNSGSKIDQTECEKKLGKPPPVPPAPTVTMTISESVVERLKTGAVDESRRVAYDNYWIEKLDCMDKSHTNRNNLDLNEAEKILKDLLRFVESGSEKPCPVDRSKIMNCFSANKGNTLRCEGEVRHFVDCVDKLLYRATRLGDAGTTSNKKLSYAERFKRGY